jgi:CRISPR/Cas system-associated protein Cas7 (RAMP superfamily)
LQATSEETLKGFLLNLVLVFSIRMDLQVVGCGHVDWIGLAQDRDRWRTLVSAVMNLGVPVKCGEFLD